MNAKHLVTAAAMLLAAATGWADSPAADYPPRQSLLAHVLAEARSPCASCEVQLGVGGTYHFWGNTDGVVLPVTVSWDRGRYEFGVFRFASAQKLEEPMSTTGRTSVDPYWGASLSRRWQLLDRGPIHLFGGFGISYKTQLDTLSATHWNFASQLGLRLKSPRGRTAVELSMRHWSNGGIKLPNHGQDFATLTMRVDLH
ncbi:MAG TPA: acyloxyacyl hydrolase [Steroidobacteraceae bacterium]|nr:acyloxyacyl hydrolase [Steroidobacteraceae bacterium]